MLMVRVNLIISIWWHLIFCLFDLKKKRIFHKKKQSDHNKGHCRDPDHEQNLHDHMAI